MNNINEEQILELCYIEYTINGNEDKVMELISEIASYEFKCPDRCDDYAVWFYNEYEKEIEGV